MSVQAQRWAYATRGLEVGDKAVLVALAWHHNGTTGRCDPSVSLLAADTELSRRSVQRSLRELERQELIATAPGGGGRSRSTYELFVSGVTVSPLGERGVTVSPLEGGDNPVDTAKRGVTVSPLDNGRAPLGASPTTPRGVTVSPELEVTRNIGKGDPPEVTRRTTADWIDEHGWPTGSRFVRGQTGGTFVADPLGFDRPDYSVPWSPPTFDAVLEALVARAREAAT